MRRAGWTHGKNRKPLKRGAWIKPAGRIKPKKRKPSEFARIYGSRERIEFVQSLPCCAQPAERSCGGRSDCAHTTTGGMGRKADAATIVPLCRLCHMMLHHIGIATFQERYAVDLAAEASRVAALWDARENAA